MRIVYGHKTQAINLKILVLEGKTTFSLLYSGFSDLYMPNMCPVHKDSQKSMQRVNIVSTEFIWNYNLIHCLSAYSHHFLPVGNKPCGGECRVGQHPVVVGFSGHVRWSAVGLSRVGSKPASVLQGRAEGTEGD